MKERPIMFKAEMVRAILGDRKTQTRRPVKRGQVFRFCRDGEGPCDLDATERREINAGPFQWYPNNAAHPSIGELLTCCPYGVPGDRLWVKETLQRFDRAPATIQYAATMSPMVANQNTESDAAGRALWPWGDRKKHSAMFMPRWASRITLEIVSVSVERICAISANSALAEGIAETPFWTPKELESRPFEEKWWDDFEFWTRYPQLAFSRGWDSMYGKTPFAWSKDPWVWVVEFRRVQR